MHRQYFPGSPPLALGRGFGRKLRGAIQAYRSAVRGSRISRKPSPKRLNANTAKEIARPGKIARYGRVSICSRQVEIRPPVRSRRWCAQAQKRQGGDDQQLDAQRNSGLMMTGDMQLGRTWRKQYTYSTRRWRERPRRSPFRARPALNPAPAGPYWESAPPQGDDKPHRAPEDRQLIGSDEGGASRKSKIPGNANQASNTRMMMVSNQPP